MIHICSLFGVSLFTLVAAKHSHVHLKETVQDLLSQYWQRHVEICSLMNDRK